MSNSHLFLDNRTYTRYFIQYRGKKIDVHKVGMSPEEDAIVGTYDDVNKAVAVAEALTQKEMVNFFCLLARNEGANFGFGLKQLIGFNNAAHSLGWKVGHPVQEKAASPGRGAVIEIRSRVQEAKRFNESEAIEWCANALYITTKDWLSLESGETTITPAQWELFYLKARLVIDL